MHNGLSSERWGEAWAWVTSLDDHVHSTFPEDVGLEIHANFLAFFFADRVGANGMNLTRQIAKYR